MKILGFDLGDGESAVAVLDTESTVEPRIVPVQDRSSTLSAVGIREGKVVIGEEATVLLGASHTQVRFKSRYLTDPEAQGDIRLFAQGMMQELTRQDPGIMTRVQGTVVGCPAGWGEKRREAYAALIESAGFPNVSVVPESRAAFLYARHARGLQVDPVLMQKSAMVIDIGSSTTDFAYIVDGHQQDLSLFGDVSLGGGVLDELILEECVSVSPERKAIESTFRESQEWRSYCEVEARRLKERYFLSEENWEEQPLTKRLTLCYDQTAHLTLSLTRARMDKLIRRPVRVLGGRSFLDTLRETLQTAVRSSSDLPPQVVILTGGASRMSFFRDCCREAFSGSVLVFCPEPECSIARGLAYCGRVDENLRVFRQEVASIARGEMLGQAVGASIHELYEPIAQVLVDTAQETAMRDVGIWRQGGFETIEKMDEALAGDIRKAFSEEKVRKRLETRVASWLEKLMGTLDARLMDLCERCGVPPERLSLSRTQVDTGLEHVGLSVQDALGMEILTPVMSIVLGVVGAAICGGGGIALVGAGPVGVLTGAVMGVLIAILGSLGLQKALGKVRIPVLLRQLVRDSAVKKGLERQRKSMEKELISALADPRNGFSARLCQSLSQTLGVQLERMAREAEMSIEA